MPETILAIETSSRQGGVVLLRDGEPVHTIALEEGLRHGTALMPAVQGCLNAGDLRPSELSAVAVGIGPGSYTGTRIGVMSGKALAWGAGVPLIGIGSLDALAWSAREQGTPVLVIMDSRRGEGLIGLFAVTDKCTALRPLVAIDLERIGELTLPEPTIVVGASVARDPVFFQSRLPSSAIIHPNSSAPPAQAIAELAAMRLAADFVDDAMELQPIYLRKEDFPDPFASPTSSIEAG